VPPVPRDPLLIEVIAAIGAGRIDLGPIHDDDSFVDGYAEPNGRVRINPAPAVVETALHEMLHRMRPKWSERSVRAKATRLIRALSDPEIDRLYDVILSTARLTRTPSSL
jgi:hypothetical protein